MHGLLAGQRIDPDARAKIEAGVSSSTAELMRLGKRMLDLDASVIAAALRTLLKPGANAVGVPRSRELEGLSLANQG